LLVVIGIIALLISILLPTLGRARAEAKSVQCLSNLRQIGLGILLYANNSKTGQLPLGFWNGAYPNSNPFTNPAPSGWNQGQHQTNWVLLTMAAMTHYSANTADAYYDNSNTAKVRSLFRCPEAPDWSADNQSNSASTDYVSNPRLICDVWNTGWPASAGSTTPGKGKLTQSYRLTSIKNPTQIALIFDGVVNWSASFNSWATGGDYQVPVADDIDAGALFSAPTNETNQLHLLTSYAGNPLQTGNQSVNMRPYPSGSPLYVNQDTMSNQQNTGNIRFRHLNNTQANALMVDGHCESFRFNSGKAVDDPNVTSFLRKNLYVNPWGQDAQ
jgi:prepilin-type processing-associated H-X9-DG protein